MPFNETEWRTVDKETNRSTDPNVIGDEKVEKE